MPRPVPLVLVVKNGSKILLPLLGGRAPARCRARRRGRPGRPSSSAGSAADRRSRPGRRQAARALSRMLRKTCSRRNGSTAQRRSTPSTVLAQRRPRGPARAGSRCAQASRQTSRRSHGAPLQLDRGGVAADVLVEVVEVVLGLLDAGRSGRAPRAGPRTVQGEHLQAGLAALQGVAALVGQAGDHLADGRQPLGLQGPLLGLLQVGDVLADRRGSPGRPRSRRRRRAFQTIQRREPSRQTTGFSKPRRGRAGEDPVELVGDRPPVGLGQEQRRGSRGRGPPRRRSRSARSAKGLK